MPERTVDQNRFRHVLGYVPTAVVVVTGMNDGSAAGLAVGSFTSVSLNPPLVAFFPSKTSSSWPRIRAAGAFCVNILCNDQEDVCRTFASRADDRFAGIDWSLSPSGSPILERAVGWIDCSIDRVDDVGDHWFVVGKVLELSADEGASPLVFHCGRYTELSQEIT